MARIKRRPTIHDYSTDVESGVLHDATIGQQWRFRRNLVMFVAHRQGLSQRLLADVFDLPRSRVSVILKEFRGLTGAGSTKAMKDRLN